MKKGNYCGIVAFLALLSFVYCDHTVTVKQYCWECSLKNNTHCSVWQSTKVRCPEQDELLINFLCFERSYNVSNTIYSERGCIRQDYYDAGYLCFKDLENCQTKVCEDHLCNSSPNFQSSFVNIAFLSLLATVSMVKNLF
ncbi:uncharacterized protein [Clytia hemisphaerica]|uniref:Protein quiver n=1 Tax=Clytia hemisphaerica TaxID=252671 RepID=A0A7M5VAI1_9CNID|eukprot:TCONS_00005294-protein